MLFKIDVLKMILWSGFIRYPSTTEGNKTKGHFKKIVKEGVKIREEWIYT